MSQNRYCGVILDLDTLDRGDLDLSPLKDLIPDLISFANTSPEELDARLVDQDIVLTNKVVLNKETLERHPHIRFIGVLATGMNNIDLAAAEELGIAVRNVKAYGTPSVVQHVYSLILSLARSQKAYLRAVESGRWGAQDKFCLLDHPIEDLTGKTLGVIGYGELGQGVARVAPTFGMDVLVAERPGAEPRNGRVPFDEVVENSDVLTLHCPLTPENEGFVNAALLARMKPTGWLINTARGALVNEKDLANALDQGVISAAALDVLAEEPPRPHSPSPLLDKPRDNLLITPHIAWAAVSARQKVVELSSENIKEFLAKH